MLKVGIAGYGIVGKRRRKCVEQNAHVILAGVCDKVFESNGRLEDGVPFFNNYQDLLKQDLDALIICMTNDVAAEVTISALKRGIHVFCEKPPGKTVDDIKSARKLEALNPKLKLMYGFNHRYHKSVKEALEIAKEGELGSIINLRAVYGKSKLVTFNQGDWRTKREIAGGGVLLDQGIHMVDLMRLFAGEFEEIKSYVSSNYWGYDVEDNAYALMKTKNGIIGMLNSSATQWKHQFSLDINFEKGSIRLSGILSGSKSYGAECLTVLKVNHDLNDGTPAELMQSYNTDDSWDEEINDFIDSIINNKSVKSGSSYDALQTMATVFKIYYADKEWRERYDIEEPAAYE